MRNEQIATLPSARTEEAANNTTATQEKQSNLVPSAMMTVSLFINRKTDDFVQEVVFLYHYPILSFQSRADVEWKNIQEYTRKGFIEPLIMIYSIK